VLYNALSVWKKTHKTAPYPWDFVTLPEEDRATALGNMQKKFGKDRACGSGDILADRQRCMPSLPEMNGLIDKVLLIDEYKKYIL